jgi:uncharacterized membrane protein
LLNEKCSQFRKEGRDPFFADQLVKQAFSRIYMAVAAEDEREASKVEMLLSDAENELKQEAGVEMVDVRKEIEERYLAWCSEDAKRRAGDKAKEVY